MVTEEVFYWQIHWAGRWMQTSQQFAEGAIRLDHPEAIGVNNSRDVLHTPVTPQERMQAFAMARTAEPGVRYNLT